jgi:hypothetical protein
MYNICNLLGRKAQDRGGALDNTLLLEVLVCLAVVHVALVVLELLHSLLLKDLVPALLL